MDIATFFLRLKALHVIFDVEVALHFWCSLILTWLYVFRNGRVRWNLQLDAFNKLEGTQERETDRKKTMITPQEY
jgi:hypothetical protein